MGQEKESKVAMGSRYDVTVSAATQYLAEQSDEAAGRYVFAYTITLRNTGSVAAQLISRQTAGCSRWLPPSLRATARHQISEFGNPIQSFPLRRERICITLHKPYGPWPEARSRGWPGSFRGN